MAKTTKKRLDQHIADTAAAIHFINHGGTVSGSITCSGLATSGGTVTTSGGAVNAGTGTLTIGAINASGTCTLDHIVMNGNINLSGNNCNTANGYVMSGAPHRANLGTVAFNAAGLQSVADRADFIQNTEGTGTGWASRPEGIAVAGLMLNTQIINQEWGTAVLSLARDLALCKGINDVLSDADRMPGGASSALQSLGFSSTDAGLIIASFGT